MDQRDVRKAGAFGGGADAKMSALSELLTYTVLMPYRQALPQLEIAALVARLGLRKHRCPDSSC